MRNVFRRLERLETRSARVRRNESFSARILLVNAEQGLTGVLLIESGKPTTSVPATREEEESVRASMERRRTLREGAGALDDEGVAEP
jgi:hypothetical protein